MASGEREGLLLSVIVLPEEYQPSAFSGFVFMFVIFVVAFTANFTSIVLAVILLSMFTFIFFI